MAQDETKAEHWEQYAKKRIIGLAIERGLPLRKISVELDRGATYVQNIVGTKGRNVSLRKFLEILDVLQVSPQEFFDPYYKNIDMVKHATNQMNRLPQREQDLVMSLIDLLAEKAPEEENP